MTKGAVRAQAKNAEEAQEVRPLRVLSLGAGVQSTTLLLMACRGDFALDAAVFADTGWEPWWVYQHLDWLEGQAQAAGIPFYRVGPATLRADALANKTESWMPLYTRDPQTGRPQQLKRQCTRNYKIRPIRQKVRALMLARGQRRVEQIVGISLDEWQRMRVSDVQYITNVYPLVDRRMTRADCVAWLTAHGHPIPRKSACIACPYRTTAEWREIRADGPSWADATDFDARVRSVRLRTERLDVFVHRQAVPLVDVDLSTEQERGQMEMDFDGCGVLCANEAIA